MLFYLLWINLLEVPEGEEQRSLRSDGVLIVRRASKQAVTKHNGAYNKFISGELLHEVQKIPLQLRQQE